MYILYIMSSSYLILSRFVEKGRRCAGQPACLQFSNRMWSVRALQGTLYIAFHMAILPMKRVYRVYTLDLEALEVGGHRDATLELRVLVHEMPRVSTSKARTPSKSSKDMEKTAENQVKPWKNAEKQVKKSTEKSHLEGPEMHLIADAAEHTAAGPGATQLAVVRQALDVADDLLPEALLIPQELQLPAQQAA